MSIRTSNLMDSADESAEGAIGRLRSRALSRSLPQVLPLAVIAATTVVLGWYRVVGKSISVVPSFQTATYPWAATPNGLRFVWPQSDSAESSFPWAALAHTMWRSGSMPLWDPHSFGGGEPLATDGVSATLYPVRALIDWLFAPALAHDGFVLFHVLLAGLGAYWFARRLGLSRAAACVSGVTWMTNTYVWGYIQLEMLTPFFALLPIALAAADLGMERRRPIDFAAGPVVLAIAVVSGNVVFGVLIATAVGVYLLGRTIGRLITSGWRPALRVFVTSALILALGAGLSALIMLPTYKNLNTISRKRFSYQTLTREYLITWSDLQRFWQKPSSPITSSQLHPLLYLTPVVLALAVLGLFIGRGLTGWTARALVALPILGAIGGPVTWFLYHLMPGFDAVRPYARLLPICLLGASLAVGASIDSLGYWIRRTKWLRRVQPSLNRIPSLRRIPAGLALVAIVAIAVPSVAVDHAINPPALKTTKYLQFPPAPAIAAIQAQQKERSWPLRTLPVTAQYTTPPDSTSLSPLIGGTSLVFGLDSWGGYDSAVPVATEQMVRMVEGDPVGAALDVSTAPEVTHPVYLSSKIDWPLACRLGTDLVYLPPQLWPNEVIDFGSLTDSSNLQQVYAGQDGRIYRLPGCSAAPYLSSRAVVSASKADTVAKLQSQGLAALATGVSDGHRPVIDSGGKAVPPADSGASGRILSSERGARSATLRTTTSGAMWLVLPMNFDSGWSATVDGHNSEIRQADFSHMAIRVPVGTHTVAFEFTPPGWNLGAVATGISAVAIAAICAWDARRRRKRREQAVSVE